MPATRSSSAARPTSCRSCPRASCARASSRSSATASCSIRTRSSPRSSACGGRASRSTRDNLRIADNATLILSLHRELDALRESGGAGTKIGTTKRGIGPAYEDKVGRRAIRLMDLADLDALPARSSGCSSHHNALRRGFGARGVRRRRDLRRARLGRAAGAALHGRGLAPARRGAPRRQAHPVRGRAGRAARHRPRHLSVRHLLEHRRRPGGDRLRPRAEARSAMCSASPRPTRRGSARGRSRPSSTTRSASSSASAGASSAPSPGASAAAAGSTPCSCARPCAPRGIDGIALTKLDVLDGLDAIRVCTGYRLDGETLDHLPASAGRAGARRAGLRGDRGLAGLDAPAPAPGPSCRRRRSNMSAGSRS